MNLRQSRRCEVVGKDCRGQYTRMRWPSDLYPWRKCSWIWRPSGVDISDSVSACICSRTKLISRCCVGVYHCRDSESIMHWSWWPLYRIRSVSVMLMVMLCWYKNCRTDVIHVGVMYEILLLGFSSRLKDTPASSWVYLRLIIKSFPASDPV